MSFFNIMVFNVRLWIILYLGFTLTVLTAVLVYWKREQILGFYYRARWTEKVVKVVIHYPSNIYKIYWRLIPDDDVVKIDKKKYIFSDKTVNKNRDLFGIKTAKDTDNIIAVNNLMVKDEGTDKYILIGDKRYTFYEYFKIKEKWKKYGEIHYIYNNPLPLEFSIDRKDLKVNASQMGTFEENNLFTQLLTLRSQQLMWIIVLVLVALNLVVTGFLTAKMMGWLE